jgi:hypothetical protein
LQDNSESTEDQSRVDELSSKSGKDLSGREPESVEDLFGRESVSAEDPLGSPEDPSTQVSPRQRTRKSHYVPPPLVPTNSASRPVIRPGSDR